MTATVRQVGDDARMLVPGTWASVPMDDPDRARAYVKKLVRRQVGRDDRLARLRRDAVNELMASARDAALTGVHTYLMSLELLPGVPFPAAILMVDERWPTDESLVAAGDDSAAALAMAFPEAEVAEQSHGPVARVVEMTEGSVGSGENETQMLSMRLEYHVPYPARDQLLLVRATVPNIPQAEPFALLFDEIVDSITFRA